MSIKYIRRLICNDSFNYKCGGVDLRIALLLWNPAELNAPPQLINLERNMSNTDTIIWNRQSQFRIFGAGNEFLVDDASLTHSSFSVNMMDWSYCYYKRWMNILQLPSPRQIKRCNSLSPYLRIKCTRHAFGWHGFPLILWNFTETIFF